MATADKLITVAENVPKVYHAGQMNVVENAECLKGSKTDTAMLLDDVSPITHEMAVKISSETVEDLKAVTVSRYGKNLFDISSSRGFESTLGGFINTINENILEVECTVSARMGFLELGTFPKGTYTFSYNESYNLSQTIMTGSDIPNLKALGSSFTTNTKTFTLSKESKVWVRNTGFSKGGSPFIYSNIQLELNSTATDYEPYISPTDYTPNADGTVEGVTSLYPNTTLLTDKDGVIIDCDYYKDIDKAFNELTTSVALSGGE